MSGHYRSRSGRKAQQPLFRLGLPAAVKSRVSQTLGEIQYLKRVKGRMAMAKSYKNIKAEISFTIGDIIPVYHSLKQYADTLRSDIESINSWTPEGRGPDFSALNLQVMRTDRLMALEESLESTERALGKVMAYLRHPL